MRDCEVTSSYVGSNICESHGTREHHPKAVLQRRRSSSLAPSVGGSFFCSARIFLSNSHNALSFLKPACSSDSFRFWPRSPMVRSFRFLYNETTVSELLCTESESEREKASLGSGTNMDAINTQHTGDEQTCMPAVMCNWNASAHETVDCFLNSCIVVGVVLSTACENCRSTCHCLIMATVNLAPGRSRPTGPLFWSPSSPGRLHLVAQHGQSEQGGCVVTSVSE